MRTTPRNRPTTLLLAAAVAVLASALAGTAAAAPAASKQATSRCWLAVINDWLDNSRIDHVYAIPCYTQAIQHLSAYPDVEGYSSAADDIKRAELDAIHQDRQNGPHNGQSLGGGGGGNSSGTPPGAGGRDNGPKGPSSSPIGQIGDKIGPGSAQSVPLPLLVLGGLAVLLVLSAVGTYLARRLQARRLEARRVAPATAPVHRR